MSSNSEPCKSLNEKKTTMPACSNNRQYCLTRETPIDNRDEYVAYLEDKLERVTTAFLELHCFEDRLAKLENLRNLGYRDGPQAVSSTVIAPHQAEKSDIVILKNRLILLEEKVNLSVKESCNSHESIQNITIRMQTLEQTCLRLADDAMEAVQSMNSNLFSLEPKLVADGDAKLAAAEKRLSTNISNSIDQVTEVLRKFIAFQKILYDRTGATRASTPVINPKTAAIQELYRELEYMQKTK